MKKTMTAFVAALFSMTALASPAAAGGDGVRLGIGIAGAILGEVLKGAGGKHGQDRDRQPRRGDTLLGRADDNQSERSSTPRKRKAAVAAPEVAYAMPDLDKTPVPMSRPDPATLVATADPNPVDPEPVSAPISSEPVVSQAAVTDAEDEDVPVYDENGRTWGYVSQETAQKIGKAVERGVKPSDAIAALTNLERPKDPPKPESYDNQPPASVIADAVRATAEQPQPAPPVIVVDQPAAQTQTVATATPIVEAAKPVEAAKAQPENIDLGSTSSTIEAPKAEPVEPVKPKMDIDL